MLPLNIHLYCNRRLSCTLSSQDPSQISEARRQKDGPTDRTGELKTRRKPTQSHGNQFKNTQSDTLIVPVHTRNFIEARVGGTLHATGWRDTERRRCGHRCSQRAAGNILCHELINHICVCQHQCKTELRAPAAYMARDEVEKT